MEKVDKMVADNTRVDTDRGFDSFNDWLGDNKSVTIIKVNKMKAPTDIEDMDDMDDDVQDGTAVDISDIIKKLMKK